HAEETDYEFGGHVKTRLLGDRFPGDSIFNQLAGSSAVDVESDLRLDFKASKASWSFDAAWQLFAGYGDRIEFTRSIPDNVNIFGGRLPNDDRRLFNLTSVIEDDGKFAAVHRLDRAWLGHTSDKTVLRFGRQAISWGNGLIFSPMDIVNPFDPTAVDTEYKAGDDMLYGQYLRDDGDDVQAALVFRRAIASGDPETDEGTAAVKYHGILGESEYDLLIAKHHDERTYGVGGNRGLGGAVWRGDLIVSETASGTKVQLVTNLSYSWVWGGKNVSGVVEYYFNEFGQQAGHYDLASITQNTDLLERLVRGETFTLGRNYLAGGLTIELTPLWTITPNVFANMGDNSALVQIVSKNNLSQNMEFLGALNVPVGPSGSEFGGIGSDQAGVYLSTDMSLFAQLAWYF
ncbi:MAG: hypothetical protein OES26_25170, partial [Gammaproteobacteria bacterium]|nr:hypothetical protein [Gammaproteobacteria bacterium]